MNWLFLLLLLIATPAQAYKFASGSYTGNSADNRNIVIASTTSPSVTSFQPDVVFVKCRGGQPMMWSTRDMIATLGEAAIRLDASTGIFTDVIQAFNSDGFQVGTSDGDLVDGPRLIAGIPDGLGKRRRIEFALDRPSGRSG